MAPLLNRMLTPRFQTVLASAWISKRVAAKYVQEYIKQIREQGKQPEAKREVIAFAPPIQVQVLDVGESASYEALDAINGGEDSLFHARIKQNLVFGVSDGVGGWNESGIDPSVFSRSLTAYSATAAERSFLLHDSDEADPKDIMRRAFASMRYDNIPAYGSATELVVSLSLASGKLRTAQLGDSTYVLLDQKQKARFVSTEQQHRFNMPFQLTIPPISEVPLKPRSEDAKESAQFFRPRPLDDDPKEALRIRKEIDADDFADLSSVGFDAPTDARENTHTMAHNEVVVAATDGLFDNVRVDEVEKLAERFMQAIGKIQSVKDVPALESKATATSDLFGGLAYSIAAQAVANYIQGDLRSPFAERAKLAGYSFTGGKPDDVTVMLAWIKDTSKPDQKISNLSAKL
ncbi:Protein phosphatase 2C 7 [Coemansia sp. RSA 353]|nr:Protein phosphatase 2C 7 [Coemansia sp. RSA 637]KAJ2142189.1 Protein phosphatase 2C 7 [Coemansia sp. RSA 564]KAJ2165431.1 Protein phosphatase 2C 7 [Coemansia sp. RSA 562]KAJ2247561.1 Protein phosphatase 2C 7 [Coemansia sp. RSA 454]KAJ2289441.1 Protein phosphatase 2C 7 [Coemansia sp. RSA 355]KAJ2296979.1 Protein phosphatase 2C 7 [Coemansia sp. RSA 353]